MFGLDVSWIKLEKGNIVVHSSAFRKTYSFGINKL